MSPKELDEVRARYRDVTANWPEVYRDCVSLVALVNILHEQVIALTADSVALDRLCESLRAIKAAAKAPGYNWGAMGHDIDAGIVSAGRKP